jgi:hypothetical protein
MITTRACHLQHYSLLARCLIRFSFKNFLLLLRSKHNCYTWILLHHVIPVLFYMLGVFSIYDSIPCIYAVLHASSTDRHHLLDARYAPWRWLTYSILDSYRTIWRLVSFCYRLSIFFKFRRLIFNTNKL